MPPLITPTTTTFEHAGDSSSDDPMCDVLIEALRQRWLKYDKAFKKCRQQPTEKRVKDLRVAIRRLMVCLTVLQSLGSEKTIKQGKRSLKKQVKQFGPLRDVLVQRMSIEQLQMDFPELKLLDEHLLKREQKLIKRSPQHLKKRDKSCVKDVVQHQLKKLASLQKACRKNKKREKTYAKLWTKARLDFELMHQRKTAIVPSCPDTIHETRLALKKFRYTAEMLAPILPNVDVQLIKQLKNFQTQMGNIQDVDVLLTQLERHMAQADEAGLFVAAQKKLLRQRQARIAALMRVIPKMSDLWHLQAT